MGNSILKQMASIVINESVVKERGGNAAEVIQEIIDNNPNRTIYFADGVYVVDKPICTPADPTKSVDLSLARFAVIKASNNWNHSEAVVRLGGKDPFNTIRVNGSNYSLTGGIIDGSGIANGISIDSGRETLVQDVSIKNTKIGLYVKFGANNGSSDCDIRQVNIVGNKAHDSIGVFVAGLDNRFSNMRIADVFTGVRVVAPGNFFSDIHPLYTLDYTDYSESCAFRDEIENNWYFNCYNDQFGIGFYFTKGGTHILTNCYNYWYSSNGGRHIGIKNNGPFNSSIVDFKMDTRDNCDNIVLEHNGEGGVGIFERLSVKGAHRLKGDDYVKFMKDNLIER